MTHYESFDDDTFKAYNDECLMHFSFLRFIKGLYASLDSKMVDKMEEQQMKLLDTFIKKGGEIE